jgi:hypothetical protein
MCASPALPHVPLSPTANLVQPSTSPIPPNTELVAPTTTPSPASSGVPREPHPSQPLPYHHMITRSCTGSLHPKSFADFKLYQATRHPSVALHVVLSEIEPICFTKATADSRWKAAMTQEFEALISNGTWTLCPRPLNQHVIRNRWVYKIKQRSDGSIDRFKARLVAKGFEPQSGVDYTETFSPMIKSPTIYILLALAVHYNWPIKQLDVSNAFLHGSLMEEVFMEQPQGLLMLLTLSLFANSISPSIVSNKPLDLGINVYHLLYCILVFKHHWLILHCFFLSMGL